MSKIFERAQRVHLLAVWIIWLNLSIPSGEVEYQPRVDTSDSFIASSPLYVVSLSRPLCPWGCRVLPCSVFARSLRDHQGCFPDELSLDVSLARVCAVGAIGWANETERKNEGNWQRKSMRSYAQMSSDLCTIYANSEPK